MDSQEIIHIWEIILDNISIPAPKGMDSSIVETMSSRQDEAKAADEKGVEVIMKASETALVVATLLVTVTFAASFTFPGGFDSDSKSANKGTALLIRNAAFWVFVVTDAIAFACSIGAMFMYFTMADQRRISLLLENYGRMFPLLLELYVNAATLLIYSMFAIVIAFITGMCATLGHSTALAVAASIIGSTSFLAYFSVCVTLTRHNKPVVFNINICGLILGTIIIPSKAAKEFVES